MLPWATILARTGTINLSDAAAPVSRPPQSVTAPDLSGKPSASARQTLTKAAAKGSWSQGQGASSSAKAGAPLQLEGMPPPKAPLTGSLCYSMGFTGWMRTVSHPPAPPPPLPT